MLKITIIKIITRVDREAYLAADLLRTIKGVPKKISEEISDGIKGYLKSVVQDEWKLMGTKKESPKTLQKLETFWKPIYEFIPITEHDKIWFNQTLYILMQFNNARLERIYTSWESLGLLSWLAVIGGGIVVVSFLFFFGTENILAQILINSLFIGLLSFFVYVIYAFDNPFQAPQAITPRAYEIVYNYYIEGIETNSSPEDIHILNPH